VNFSDAATAPPAGYVRDSGDAFSTTRGYGWVAMGTTTPLSLAGNGRNRNPAAGQADVRLATLIHAQLPAGSAGVTTPGSWEAVVPDGTYTVTVAVGDAGTAVNSVHWLSIEDQNAVAAFTPTASVKHATATRTVRVSDGRLTLSPAGGTNTKLNYVDVASVPGAGALPGVRTSTPANGATGVSLTSSVWVEPEPKLSVSSNGWFGPRLGPRPASRVWPATFSTGRWGCGVVTRRSRTCPLSSSKPTGRGSPNCGPAPSKSSRPRCSIIQMSAGRPRHSS